MDPKTRADLATLFLALAELRQRKSEPGAPGPAGRDGINGLDGEQGPQGERGATGETLRPQVWHVGGDEPDNSVGEDGDFWLTDNGDLFEKIDGFYEFVLSLKGPPGVGGGSTLVFPDVIDGGHP